MAASASASAPVEAPVCACILRGDNVRVITGRRGRRGRGRAFLVPSSYAFVLHVWSSRMYLYLYLFVLVFVFFSPPPPLEKGGGYFPS